MDARFILSFRHISRETLSLCQKLNQSLEIVVLVVVSVHCSETMPPLQWKWLKMLNSLQN